MGYCSEIGLCLAAPAQAKLKLCLMRLKNGEGTDSAEKRKLILELFQYATLRKDEESGAAAYHWDSLKWYSEYQDVAFVEKFLEEQDEDEYLFIRLGESEDDTEFKGTFWGSPFGMALARSIVFN